MPYQSEPPTWPQANGATGYMLAAITDYDREPATYKVPAEDVLTWMRTTAEILNKSNAASFDLFDVTKAEYRFVVAMWDSKFPPGTPEHDENAAAIEAMRAALLFFESARKNPAISRALAELVTAGKGAA